MSRKKQGRLPQTPVLAHVEKFSHDGRGIARINGKTTFIQGALPDEDVSFLYTRKKSDYDEGRVQEINKASVHRVTPRCNHYQVCGGCSLQHLDENQQIEVKQNLLLDLLHRTGHCEPQEILMPLTSDSWHYRTKARLSVRFVEKKQTTFIGFRERHNPRFISEINHCPILYEKVDNSLPLFRQLLDSFDSPKSIAQIEVAAGDDEVALIFRNLEALSNNDEQKLKDFATQQNFIIFLQPGGPETVTRFYPPAENDFLHYNLPEENINFCFHPTDFTQVNIPLNRLMIARAMQLLDLQNTDNVLDLFCGLGNFSLPIAKRAHKVIGIEGSKAMVERARMNAELNDIQNAAFFYADLEQVDAIAKCLSEPINKILLDPPRSGALQVVSQVHQLAPSHILYISCNPATLARDSDILVNQQGYQLISAGVMDMFPHTAHVESIALFKKG